jgi:predicted oxidoreductase
MLTKPRSSLGNSGLKISKIILGTMSYGSSQWQDWVLNEDEALPMIEHAYKRGINTWDTVSDICQLLTRKDAITDDFDRPISIPTASQRRSSARP